MQLIVHPRKANNALQHRTCHEYAFACYFRPMSLSGLEISQEDFDNFVTLINSVEQDEKQSNTKTWNFHINVIYKSIQFVEEKDFLEMNLNHHLIKI